MTPEQKPGRGDITVKEAGRLGGQALKNLGYGRDHFYSIGKKGGDAVARTHGRQHYVDIGRRGGETIKAKRGKAFYVEIGKKGGDTVKANHDPRYYAEIGRLGGIAKGQRKAKGQKES